MWRKTPDWLIYLVIVIAIYANANRASEKIDAMPTPPELGPMLPSETPRDERVVVNVKRADSGIGTAFAIDEKGRWMTARHVVDSCDEVGIDIGNRKVLRVEGYVSEDSDTAILQGLGNANPLLMTSTPDAKLANVDTSLAFLRGVPAKWLAHCLRATAWSYVDVINLMKLF